MKGKFRNKKLISKVFLLILMFLYFLVPLSGISVEFYSNSINNDNNNIQEVPKTHDFKKDDYEPLLEEETYGLGSITITDIFFNEVGFNKSDEFSELNDDLESGSLNMTYIGTKFSRTKKIAQVDNLEDIDTRTITIELNESISVQYNTSIGFSEGYLIYAPRLIPFNLTELWVENDTFYVVKVNEGNYSVTNVDNINFVKFKYKDYFKYNALNFTMHLIWEYQLTITDWRLLQDLDSKFILEENEEEVKPEFNYRFNLKGEKLNDIKEDQIVLADNLKLALKVSPPDKELLDDHELSFDPDLEDFIESKDLDNYLDSTGTVNIDLEDSFTAGNSFFYLKFEVEFKIGFNDPVDETWAVDRLIEGRNKRERLYLPEIISGPKHIYIKFLTLHELTISIDQVDDDGSLFDRSVKTDEANITEIDEEIKNSLVFTENATRRIGIYIRLPYMYEGEICPINIKYFTSNDLRVVITDNIKMPVMGLDVKIYYYDELYGTYISKEKNQPIGPTITDENGKILVKDVPNGNFTIKIYQRDSFIMKAEVSSFYDVNYVVTSLPHFPLLILIYGTVCLIILLLGIGLYLIMKKKSKKRT